MVDDASGAPVEPRRVRADAQRNLAIVLEAAKSVFADAGVDAPVREIAARAGVGVGTIYRHFPRRADLVAAVFRREVDACADAAAALAAEFEPAMALEKWLHRFTDFIATKRGLASALHSGDPTFEPLPGYFAERLGPALGSLLDAAVAAGEIRGGVNPTDLLAAVANVSVPAPGSAGSRAQPMVGLLIDGLRYGAGTH